MQVRVPIVIVLTGFAQLCAAQSATYTTLYGCPRLR